jgi:hypothetical protein
MGGWTLEYLDSLDVDVYEILGEKLVRDSKRPET